MDPIVSTAPTLAVALILCLWQRYRLAFTRRRNQLRAEQTIRREQLLRRRVAVLLLAVAFRPDRAPGGRRRRPSGRSRRQGGKFPPPPEGPR